VIGDKMDFEQLDEKIKKELQRQLDILEYAVSEITPRDEFIKMLAHSIANNKPLRVKCGIDPTATDVHLGHTIPYRKMRQFQDLGHIGVVVIGDYTAQIGDPTGKNESRQALTIEQTKQNAKLYFEQVGKVLLKDKTEVRYQSEWFEKINLHDILGWASETTVAKLLSHDTFKNRLDNNNSLGLHELFYPVLQGMDSVYIKADVELGGSDQKFNVLMGRDYQKSRKLRPQVAMLLPIIIGTCGSQKMSKSLNNYIGVLEEPFEQFGKVMSIPDQLMPDYIKYASSFDLRAKKDYIEKLANNEIHPNEMKKLLASSIVSLFHGEAIGAEMRVKFEDVFKKKQVPDDVATFQMNGSMTILNLLVESKVVASNGEARRMLKQNAVSIVDGVKITDEKYLLDQSFLGKVIKIGRRKFVKLVE
jgi:tyrosyl-tRNA synthetase